MVTSEYSAQIKYCLCMRDIRCITIDHAGLWHAIVCFFVCVPMNITISGTFIYLMHALCGY